MKKIAAIMLFVVSVSAAILMLLRSVYSLSLFHGLTKQMQTEGWVSTQEDSVLQPDEETIYEASYLFFKIGVAKFHLVEKTVYDGIPAYKIIAHIDSYSGIPFVNYHAVYETYADAKTLMCLFTFNRQKGGNDWIHTSYNFNFRDKEIEWKQSRDGKVIKEDVLPLDRNYTDGLSFYYFVREACLKAGGRKTRLTVPIISDTVLSTVDMTINEEREPCKVTALDFPIDSYRMSGHINFIGTFGVTGDFTGWISADSSEVPLRGDLKVVLGSIVVKLKDIKGRDWIPPRGE